MLLDASVIFPNLGITIQNLPSGFYIGNFYIAFYGIIIAIGMIVGVLVAAGRAKKTHQDTDDYIDIAIIAVIASIIGARAYYVLFSLDQYDTFIQMLNIRNGGLAIYGGVIAAIIAIFFTCRYKKISVLRVLDTCAPGLVIGQCIGRWGNFFNMEAYGEYTDGLFAMQLKYSQQNGVVTELINNNMVTIDGTAYIQVTPTFLYESAACLLIFILILVFRRFQKYDGEVLLWYFGGYGLERFFVEGLRTDQLQIGSSGIAVSQLLSLALVAASFVLLVYNRVRIWRGTLNSGYTAVLPAGAPGTPEYKKARIEAKKAAKSEKRKAKGTEWEISAADDDDEKDGEP